MMASGMASRRTAWLLLASTVAVRVEGLYQTYCSNQNTGADFQGGRDESDPMFDGRRTNIGPVKDIYNSNGACQTQCQGQYAFAIVQWQSCWCSNYIPADQSDTSSCSQQCPGYPDESCGNEDQGMYGYIALGRAPSGTAGASSQAPQSSTVYSSPSSSPEPSSTPPPPSTSETPTPTSYVSQTVVSTVTEEHTQRPDTVVSTVTPTPPSTTSTAPSTSTPEYTSTAPSTTAQSHSPTPVVSTRVVTVSGQQVTQTVTSTPFFNPGSDEQDQQMTRSGLSGGAIAGIVIGTLIGLAALLLAAFLLWRRKRQQDAENAAGGSRPPKRTTSVLSKTGLLSRGTARPTSMAENNFDEGYGSVRHSMLFGGAAASVEPSSPLSGSQSGGGSTRRHSKPMVYDQRLNPSALFANAEANGSRVSMQDTQDYSRPLGIANPDVRASFESRNDVR